MEIVLWVEMSLARGQDWRNGTQVGARNPTPKGRQESGKQQNLIDCWQIPIAFVDGGSEIAVERGGSFPGTPYNLEPEYLSKAPQDVVQRMRAQGYEP
jgi:hypothetical protein